jgi:hypothetical protein
MPVVIILLACVQSVSSLDPLDSSDALQDSDHDGLSNLMEFRYATNPFDWDTDGGGASDVWEVYYDEHPAVFPENSSWALYDADGDGKRESAVPPGYLFDPTDPADEQEDADDDALCNLAEFRIGTDPTNPDTDGDGTIDSREEEEFIGCGTHPLEAPAEGRTVGTQGQGMAPDLASSWDWLSARVIR